MRVSSVIVGYMREPPKKRGRPRKKRPEETQEYWNKQLHNYRLGMDRAEPEWRVLCCELVNEEGRTAPLENMGAGGSVTQQTDALNSLLYEAASDENIALPARWLHYMEYMEVVAETLSPEDNGSVFKELFLQDARSRHWEQPPDIPPALGSPAGFRLACLRNELEIHLESNRRTHLIKIAVLPIPPDEPEDLNEAEEPPGHWNGLVWIPDPPRNGRC